MKNANSPPFQPLVITSFYCVHVVMCHVITIICNQPQFFGEHAGKCALIPFGFYFDDDVLLLEWRRSGGIQVDLSRSKSLEENQKLQNQKFLALWNSYVQNPKARDSIALDPIALTLKSQRSFKSNRIKISTKTVVDNLNQIVISSVAIPPDFSQNYLSSCTNNNGRESHFLSAIFAEYLDCLHRLEALMCFPHNNSKHATILQQ